MIRTDVMDLRTGEVIENVNVTTQEERENYKRFLKQKEKCELKKMEIDENYKQYGNFVWLLYSVNQALEMGISPEVLTKLILISTYMNYDNKLMLPNSKSMTKQDMYRLLAVSDSSCERFYNAVTSTGILTEGKDGCLCLNTDLFFKGTTQKDININRMRLYIKSIRQLYNQAKPTEHKFLSYLFQAIPFMNVNYNMLCFNPMETDFDSVKAMQLKDYCSIIGYSPDNDRRLKTKLKKIRLDGIPVFSFVDNASGLFCYINPNVLYAGSKWDEVKILGKFYKDKK
jgi:hypothetical protein